MENRTYSLTDRGGTYIVSVGLEMPNNEAYKSFIVTAVPSNQNPIVTAVDSGFTLGVAAVNVVALTGSANTINISWSFAAAALPAAQKLLLHKG